MTALALLLGLFISTTVIGWLAGFACGWVARQWRMNGADQSPIPLTGDMLPFTSPEDAVRRGGV